MTEPQFATPTPSRPGDGKALLIGLAPAIVVVVGLIVGVVWFNDPAPADPAPQTSAALDSGAQPPAGQAPAVGAPGDAAVTAEITATMQRYVDGYNAGDATLFRSSMCESRKVVASELLDGVPLEQDRAQLDGVSGVLVSGDTATAVVNASEEGSPELGSKATQLVFVNEDGWKLC